MNEIVFRLLLGALWLLTGVRGEWTGAAPAMRQRIYFANHRSHADALLIAAALPPAIRRTTRPVAARDYWERSAVRRFLAHRVIHALLIDRDPATRREDPIAAMRAALDAGASLILFPEGTRNDREDEPLLPFRSGLWHLASTRPDVELVPCWITNVGRILPKGELMPLPLLCTVRFGPALEAEAGEAKEAFLARARAGLLALRGDDGPESTR
jgi:1-acyl-sn-glycerol-3-phosphate acyltransferase